MATERAAKDIRGRVAVRMRGGKASPLILQVALRVARTFRGELHGLFFEHEDLMALARMPFGREISLTGARSRPISPETVEAEMHEALQAMEQRFEQLTEGLNLPTRFEVLHSAEERSKQALRNIGILAIGEPIALAAPETFLSFLADLPSLAGIVVTGSGARRAEGPVVAVIEPGSNIGMLVKADRKRSYSLSLQIQWPQRNLRMKRESRSIPARGIEWNARTISVPVRSAQLRDACQRGW
jgi:hypothetical protein